MAARGAPAGRVRVLLVVVRVILWDVYRKSIGVSQTPDMLCLKSIECHAFIAYAIASGPDNVGCT